MINRRNVLGLVAAGAAMPVWARSRPVPAIPLGLQLYTVLKPLMADLDGTLRKVAALGYREVETLGAFGLEPKRLRDAMDKAGLISPSQHLMPAGLEKDFDARLRREMSLADLEQAFLHRFADLDRMLDEAMGWAKVLGQRTIIWQIVWPSQLQDEATIMAFAETLNRAAKICAGEGLGFAFHNHGNELVPLNGRLPYDMIVENTDPEHVKLEMDVCWMVSKHVDPIAYMQRFPGRYRLAHLKDVDAAGKSVPIGQGVVPFPAIIAQMRRSGLRHCYMELDAASDPIGTVSDAARKLKPLLTGASA